MEIIYCPKCIPVKYQFPAMFENLKNIDIKYFTDKFIKHTGDHNSKGLNSIYLNNNFDYYLDLIRHTPASGSLVINNKGLSYNWDTGVEIAGRNKDGQHIDNVTVNRVVLPNYDNSKIHEFAVQKFHKKCIVCGEDILSIPEKDNSFINKWYE
jgi:hypothetical protein